MATYPTPTERRANRYDPVAHPVQFKRSHSTAAPSAASMAATGVRGRVERDIMYSTGATRSQRYYYAHPLTGRLLPRQEYDSAMLITQQMEGRGGRRSSRREAAGGRDEKVRPQTAGEMGRGNDRRRIGVYEEKEEMEPSRTRGNSAINRVTRPQTAQPSSSSSTFFTSSPSSLSYTTTRSSLHSPTSRSHNTLEAVDYDSDDSTTNSSTATPTTNPYDQLYSTLVSLLLAHRIVSTDGIERLLERAAEANGHLDRKKVEWVCDAVREEMRLKDETADRQRRDEDRRRAWQEDEEEDESRLESEDEEEKQQEKGEKDAALTEGEEEDMAATESQLQALASQPFYQRPPHSDGEDESVADRLQTVEQKITAGEKINEQADGARNQANNEKDYPRPHRQPTSEDEAQTSAEEHEQATTPSTANESNEQPTKDEAAAVTDDEWYEDDNESVDETQQPTPAVFEREIVRAESGTHTIEEGEEEEEDEEEEETYEKTSEEDEKESTEPAETEQEAAGKNRETAVEATSEDEYGDEAYEEEEQYESDF